MQNTPPSPTPGPSTFNPVNPDTPQHPSARATSKSSLLPKILIALLSITTLALVGFVIYHFLTFNHLPTGAIFIDSNAIAYRQEQSVLTTVNQIYDKATEIFNRDNQDEFGGFFAGLNYYTIYYNHDSNPVSYMPEGYIIGVPLDRAYGLSANSSAIEYHHDLYYNESSNREMSDFLTSLGFTITDEHYTTASAGPVGTIYKNTNTSVICSGVTFWDIACGHEDWYDKENTNFSNDLAKVYEAATGDSAHYLIARTTDIKDSPVSPYQIIDVMMSGFAASFYRTSPESPWVFAFRGQMGPTCNEYDTQDLKNAFAGRTCWNTETDSNSEVQP